ncbi:MAG: hypothetical protein GY722_11520 [bacterium]|nr:hypothetical protein [bacterium]
MDKESARQLGLELIRFLGEFPPLVAYERFPKMMRLVFEALDGALMSDLGLDRPVGPCRGREDTQRPGRPQLTPPPRDPRPASLRSLLAQLGDAARNATGTTLAHLVVAIAALLAEATTRLAGLNSGQDPRGLDGHDRKDGDPGQRRPRGDFR